MVEIGSLVSSLPNRPLPVPAVEELEEHDAIVVSEVLLTEETSTGPVTVQFALVTGTVGIIMEYVPGDGWTVIERASSDEHSPKELLLTLSIESIKAGIEDDDTAARNNQNDGI
ncbi:hypothetical protein [Saliphagus infecundisoli]|uniref:DUF7964 domain-containing protein n=1 Tax=Saliphagus infecundisoli TaxID=1849069 RepID=A0ABD5QB14_9EURY|nr:hypothetical protein [Saliphagus infecundisoli]